MFALRTYLFLGCVCSASSVLSVARPGQWRVYRTVPSWKHALPITLLSLRQHGLDAGVGVGRLRLKEKHVMKIVLSVTGIMLLRF